jgi:flavin-dependent dehydrogenase
MIAGEVGGALDDTWDCIVIGAGPAGTVAARQSALSGLKTLLVDRNPFPRAKVCGACLNHRALTALNNFGLSSWIEGTGGLPIDSFMLRGFGGEFRRDLPPGVAVSRASLDSAHMNAAVEAGAIARTAVIAKVFPTDPHARFRNVRLQHAAAKPSSSSTLPREVRARVVIAADGLGHPSLKSVGEFSESLSERSRVGIGACVDSADDSWTRIRPGCIYMAASREGYGGMVRVENGGVNLAAAVDPSFLKAQGSPHAAFSRLLHAAGFPPLPLESLDWRGTPALSRMINRVADHRVLVVGDAAGYVEPFTGEGIAWALIGGHAVARSAVMFAADECDQAVKHWQNDWSELVRRRQRWCRRLAWLLRHPKAAAVGVALANRFPGMTDRIVHQMNT